MRSMITPIRIQKLFFATILIYAFSSLLNFDSVSTHLRMDNVGISTSLSNDDFGSEKSKNKTEPYRFGLKSAFTKTTKYHRNLLRKDTFKHLFSTYPKIFSFPLPPSTKSHTTSLMHFMDVMDIKDDTVYVIIHEFREYLRYQLEIPYFQLEHEMTENLHRPPVPYNSRYFKESIGRYYPTIREYSCYRSLEGSYQTMDNLASQYPDFVDIIDIGPSHLKSIDKNTGHEMKVLKITNKNSLFDKPPMFITCAIHPRELSTAEVCGRFAEDILGSYGTDADKTWILDYNEIHMVMQANPDGREDEENFFHFRRKNMNLQHRNNAFLELFCNETCDERLRGVDLNRNFPHSKWGTTDVDSTICNSRFPGKWAGSEKETQAITTYMEAVFPPGSNKKDPESGAYLPDSKGIMVDIHSFGQFFVWPYLTEHISANDFELSAMAKKLSSKTFPVYKSNFQSLYYASGTTNDYAYDNIGIAAITPEIGTTFHEPCDNFELTVLDNALIILFYAARITHAPFLFPKGPEILSISLPLNITSKDEIIPVTIKVSDSADAHLHDSADAPFHPAFLQNISAVRLYMDSHPYDNNATALIDMTDGFKSGSATVDFEVPISNLNNGKHAIFVQADDTDGPGPVYSKFFEISEI